MYEKEFHSLHNAQIPLPIKFKKYNLAFSAFFWVFTVHSDCHSSKKFTTLASPVLLYKRIFAYCVFETSKQQKALYSCEFRWFYVGSMQKVDMSSFVSQKRCLWYPGKSRHDIQIEKNVSNRLPGSHTRTVTNCQALVTKCDTLSRHWHIRQWNLKKTKSSICSKLKENFIHIDALKSR